MNTNERPQEHLRTLLSTALQNTHALERQSHAVLKQQVDSLAEHPTLRHRLEAHVVETETQIERLRAALERMHASPSTLKDIGMQALGSSQSMVQMIAGAKGLKAAIADQGMKGFEIASYLALIELAGSAGEDETKVAMELSLAEERQLFDWLVQHVPAIAAETAGLGHA